MFQFGRFPLYIYFIQYTMLEYCSNVFPHSDICVSSLICSSTQLFAACHVLLRLLMPWHSPYALISLTLSLATYEHPLHNLHSLFFRYIRIKYLWIHKVLTAYFLRIYQKKPFVYLCTPDIHRLPVIFYHLRTNLIFVVFVLITFSYNQPVTPFLSFAFTFTCDVFLHYSVFKIQILKSLKILNLQNQIT